MSDKRDQIALGRERRRHTRLPLERPVEVAWGDERRQVVLEDVSLSGAKMRLAHPPAVGTRLTIGSGDRRIAASVARISGDSVGIRFDDEDAALGYVISTVIATPKDG